MTSQTPSPRQKLLVVGCGYTGLKVIQRVWSVDPRKDISALVRRSSRVQELTKHHIPTLAWDLDRPTTQETKNSLNNLMSGGVVLYSTPPPREGDSDTRMRRFLASIHEPINRFIYLSTTGVYGDCRGAWIDEAQPVNPQNPRSVRRVDAERQVQQWCEQNNVTWTFLRIAGIYGPGRLPMRQAKTGDTVLKANEAPYGNHIHIDDLVRCCTVLIQGDTDVNQVINVSDGEPRRSGDLRRVVAKAADLPPPMEIGIDQAHQTFSEMRLSFAAESRRINNQRLRDLLGGVLLYPNLEIGVAKSLKEA
ncbi:MAG: NAD-dependent epimerase/dehydratase family protein [Pseudomonadota bacterium]